MCVRARARVLRILDVLLFSRKDLISDVLPASICSYNPFSLHCISFTFFPFFFFRFTLSLFPTTYFSLSLSVFARVFRFSLFFFIGIYVSIYI